MHEKMIFQALPRGQTNSVSDWITIRCGDQKVGLIRGMIKGNIAAIEFLYIFHEFRGCGYAKRAVEMLKSEFTITMDENDRWLYQKFFPLEGDAN